MSRLQAYASETVSLAWGPLIFEGLSEDSFVTMTRNSDVTNETIGSDGKAMVSVMANRSGLISVSLQQTSRTNIHLAAIQSFNELNPRDFVVAEFTLVDPSGGVFYKGINSHIKTLPELVLSSGDNNRTWTFFSERLQVLSIPEGYEDIDDLLTQSLNVYNTFTSILETI